MRNLFASSLSMFLLVVVALRLGAVAGFGVSKPSFATPTTSTTTSLGMAVYSPQELRERALACLTGKDFQLEEREDKETELSAIVFNADGTVTLGVTDGPEYKSYSGKWSILETASEEDRPFRLRLDRVYDAGSRTGANQVGEFEYHVKREFWGNLGMVGDSISVEGVVHGLDEAANVDCEVGYFSIIDETSEPV